MGRYSLHLIMLRVTKPILYKFLLIFTVLVILSLVLLGITKACKDCRRERAIQEYIDSGMLQCKIVDDLKLDDSNIIKTLLDCENEEFNIIYFVDYTKVDSAYVLDTFIKRLHTEMVFNESHLTKEIIIDNEGNKFFITY